MYLIAITGRNYIDCLFLCDAPCCLFPCGGPLWWPILRCLLIATGGCWQRKDAHTCPALQVLNTNIQKKYENICQNL